MPPETPAHEPNSPSPVLSTAPAMDVLSRMGQGLGARKPLLVLTGEAGMGKSPLAREAIRRLGDRVAYAWLAEPIAASDVAGTLLTLFGGSTRPGTSPLAVTERLLMTLANATTHGRVAMLVVDDAHALADEVLLELQRIAGRSLDRQCPLEILLVGQPELAERLAEPALAAVAAQVSQRFELAPLNAHHTRRYLLLLPAPPGTEHPPQFSRKACRDIHNEARGIPRDIELLAAESARRAAKANATTVSPEHVRAAVQALPRRAAPAKRAPAVSSTPARATQPPVAAPVRAPEPKAEAKAPEAKKPDPAKAEAAKAVTHAPPPAPDPALGSAAEHVASDPNPSGEFAASNDPRVKDWVARFGGSGVRLGGFYTGPVHDEPIEDMADEMAEPVDETPALMPVVMPVAKAEPVPKAEPVAKPERAAKPESVAKPERVAKREPALEVTKPERGRTREPISAAVEASELPGELVAWPPPRAAARTAARKGPVLGKNTGANLGWPAFALLLAVALGAVMLAQRRMLNTETETVASTVEVAPQTDDSAEATTKPQATDPSQSRRTDSSVTTVTPVPEKPKRTAKKPTATTASRLERSERVERARRAAATEAPPAGVRYTVIVGSYLKADMAWAEREHLSRLTTYPVWVSRRNIEGVRTYRIILGAFESTELAETAAQALLQRGLLRDARVVALPLAP